MSFSISSKSEFPFNNIGYRCPECFLIPFIEISYKENKLFMSTKCTNNHKFLKSFDEMQILCKKKYYNCEYCQNENKKNNENFNEMLYYCSTCYKFFCMKHGKKHNLIDDHKILFNSNFDNICFEHSGNSFVGYCLQHNKNYCILCEHFNENDKNIDEKLNKEQLENYEKEIKNNEIIINEIEYLFKINYKTILRELEYNFSIFKENINKKIKLMKDLINFYKTKEAESVINYQMKKNIENNNFNLSKSKQKFINNLNNFINEAKNLNKLFKNELELYDNNPTTNIVINSLNGEKLTIDVNSNYSLEQLKDLIYDKTKIPKDEQNLLIFDEYKEKNSNFHYLSFNNGSHLDIKKIFEKEYGIKEKNKKLKCIITNIWIIISFGKTFFL